MEISSGSPPRPLISTSLANTPSKAKPGGPDSNRSGVTANGAPSMAEREARKRVAAAVDSLNEAEQEAKARLDQVRQDYARQATIESARAEASIENQRLKSYENIREQQREQQKEATRIKREGEAELARLRDFYQAAIYRETEDAKKRLSSQQSQQTKQLEYEQKNHHLLVDDMKAQLNNQFARMKGENENKLSHLVEASHEEHERLKATSALAQEDAQRDYEIRFQNMTRERAERFGQVNSEATHKLNELRLDTSRKLAAYESRNEDPFYQMVRFDADFEDNGDAYVLRARVPEHEQSNLNITIRGGSQLVISGARRAEEKSNLEDGRKVSTSSYQSYSETFPLPVPVDPKAMTKEVHGDEVIVRVPKKGGTRPYQPYRADQVKRYQAERPRFPENLPIPKDSEGESLEGRVSEGTNTSKTITT